LIQIHPQLISCLVHKHADKKTHTESILLSSAVWDKMFRLLYVYLKTFILLYI